MEQHILVQSSKPDMEEFALEMCFMSNLVLQICAEAICTCTDLIDTQRYIWYNATSTKL